MSDYINYNFFLLEVVNNRRPKNKLQNVLVETIKAFHRTVLPFDKKISLITFITKKLEELNLAHSSTTPIDLSMSNDENNDVHFWFSVKADDVFLAINLKGFCLKNYSELLMLKDKIDEIGTSDNK